MNVVQKTIRTKLINAALKGQTITTEKLAEDVGIDTSQVIEHLEQFKASGLLDIGETAPEGLAGITAVQFTRLRCTGGAIFQGHLFREEEPEVFQLQLKDSDEQPTEPEASPEPPTADCPLCAVEPDMLEKCRNLLSYAALRQGGQLLGTIQPLGDDGPLYGVARIIMSGDEPVAADLWRLERNVEGHITVKKGRTQKQYVVGGRMVVYSHGNESQVHAILGEEPKQ